MPSVSLDQYFRALFTTTAAAAAAAAAVVLLLVEDGCRPRGASRHQLVGGGSRGSRPSKQIYEAPPLAAAAAAAVTDAP
ncbi:hypothetical protein E2C01_059283 [Portunus trituberculatus]|uniref:Uncharacterized protein n=1 Tax=Portunus trituberculatus TaxID=210409 RepID=A0A5B7H8N5_PORTR|nr:hypothetical protein [Portunus trituberculatus]